MVNDPLRSRTSCELNDRSDSFRKICGGIGSPGGGGKSIASCAYARALCCAAVQEAGANSALALFLILAAGGWRLAEAEARAMLAGSAVPSLQAKLDALVRLVQSGTASDRLAIEQLASELMADVARLDALLASLPGAQRNEAMQEEERRRLQELETSLDAVLDLSRLKDGPSA